MCLFLALKSRLFGLKVTFGVQRYNREEEDGRGVVDLGLIPNKYIRIYIRIHRLLDFLVAFSETFETP